MKSSPTISIVIPSYNSEIYIKSTLDSIFSQNYKNFEVIIQDGGSEDETVEIINNYAKKYKNLKWESKKDKGQVDAINKGLARASGEILTYINSDDLYEKGAFSAVAEVYIKYPEALWFAGRGVVIDKKGKEVAKLITLYKNALLLLNTYHLLLITNYQMQPSVFLTKKAYKKFGPFVGTKNFVMEYDLWLKLGKIEMPKVININLSKFRLSGENISSTIFNDLLKTDLEVVKKYTKNPIILLLHRVHNVGRKFTIRSVI